MNDMIVDSERIINTVKLMVADINRSLDHDVVLRGKFEGRKLYLIEKELKHLLSSIRELDEIKEQVLKENTKPAWSQNYDL